MRSLLLLSLLALGITSFGQSKKKEQCALMHSGTFKYLDAQDPTSYFVITDSTHTEYYSDGAYQIRSQMTWNSDCQYTLVMLSSTVPGFPFKPGDKLKVTIIKVEGDVIQYAAEVNGEKWKSKVKKTK